MALNPLWTWVACGSPYGDPHGSPVRVDSVWMYTPCPVKRHRDPCGHGRMDRHVDLHMGPFLALHRMPGGTQHTCGVHCLYPAGLPPAAGAM